MTQDIKNEATEQIEKEVLFGFEKPEEILEGIRVMFYDEEDMDENWLRKEIQVLFQKQQKESKLWHKPTDFDRLVVAFDSLIRQRIICIHKAGYSKQDGYELCDDAAEDLHREGLAARGYCFYHTQDLERAIHPAVKNLLLAFDSIDQNDDEAVRIGLLIVDALHQQGFDVRWDGTVNDRIEIVTIDWKKIPDYQDWSSRRVLELFPRSAS